jgi:hypothetical protein
MDVKRFGTTIALSCFIAATHPALANASGQGRGGATATGSHSGGRGTAGGASGRAQGRAPRSGTVIRSRPPTTARPDATDARTVTGWPTQAVGLASPADPNPRDSAETDVAPAPPKASVSSESSSIQPLLLSPLPQTSPSSPRGTLRLDTGPASAQLYIDGFYAGTVEEANRTEAGLSLPAGWHRLEIRAPGFVTPAINVTIEADRTVSYHAELIPLQR